MRIYTVWAAHRDDLEASWMIWACDEYTYDGDYDCQEEKLAAAKESQGEDIEYREVTMILSEADLARAFLPVKVDVSVEAAS